MKILFPVAIVALAFVQSAAAQQANFKEIFESLPGKSQTTIVAINVGHGVAQKCRIRFSRQNVFAVYVRQLRDAQASADEIARTRKAFLEFSKIYDQTPSRGSAPPCEGSERDGYVTMLKRMEQGVFPQR